MISISGTIQYIKEIESKNGKTFYSAQILDKKAKGAIYPVWVTIFGEKPEIGEEIDAAVRVSVYNDKPQYTIFLNEDEPKDF